MKYMLLIYGEEDSYTPEEREQCMVDSMKLCEELDAQGKWIDSSPLRSITTATCVRVRNDKRQVTDGPFAETTEQLGGYYLIDVENLDEAIDFAAKIPPAKKGTVEIRPLDTLPGVEETPEKSGLSITRLVDLPAEVLYRGWTDPELLKKWFCPAPWKVTHAELDPRPGGRFNTVFEGPNGERMENHGVYLEVIPGEKVVFTDAFREGWVPNGEPFFAGTVTFTKEGDKTRYTARGDHWTDEAEAKHKKMGFEHGWNAALDQLIALGEQMKATAG